MNGKIVLYRATLIAGIIVVLVALWLSFALRVSDHLKYAIMMPVGLVGVAIMKFAREKLQKVRSNSQPTPD